MSFQVRGVTESPNHWWASLVDEGARSGAAAKYGLGLGLQGVAEVGERGRRWRRWRRRGRGRRCGSPRRVILVIWPGTSRQAAASAGSTATYRGRPPAVVVLDVEAADGDGGQVGGHGFAGAPPVGGAAVVGVAAGEFAVGDGRVAAGDGDGDVVRGLVGGVVVAGEPRHGAGRFAEPDGAVGGPEPALLGAVGVGDGSWLAVVDDGARKARSSGRAVPAGARVSSCRRGRRGRGAFRRCRGPAVRRGRGRRS